MKPTKVCDVPIALFLTFAPEILMRPQADTCSDD